MTISAMLRDTLFSARATPRHPGNETQKPTMMRLRVGNGYARREVNVVRRTLIFAFLDLLKEPYSAIH